MATTITPLPPLTIEDLTVAMGGTGAFDKLMTSVSEHIESQKKKGTISSNDYATVYLGGMQAVLSTALEFLLRKRKESLEAQLIEAQIRLADVEVIKAEAQVELVQAEILKTQAELPLVEAQVRKVEAEIIILEKQGLKIPAEIALLEQQKTNLEDELLTNEKQRNKLDDDLITAGKQRELLDKQILNTVAEENRIIQQTQLLTQQVLTEVENTKVATAQECKLRAEFDYIQSNKLKSDGETALLAQKTATERAQVDGTGVAPYSVLGRQMALYDAQTKGFKMDAVTKAAKELIATWNVRRTTDSGTQANGTNRLDDVTLGSAVQKMLNTLDEF